LLCLSSRTHRLAVSDLVTRRDVPELVRRDLLPWVRCIAGALRDTEYEAKLTAAGYLKRSASSPPAFTTSRMRTCS
jgi:hypothetical protein